MSMHSQFIRLLLSLPGLRRPAHWGPQLGVPAFSTEPQELDDGPLTGWVVIDGEVIDPGRHYSDAVWATLPEREKRLVDRRYRAARIASWWRRNDMPRQPFTATEIHLTPQGGEITLG